MMKPLALGTILGGVVLFIWGGLYHAALPFGRMAFERFTGRPSAPPPRARGRSFSRGCRREAARPR
jgi:hypothetical protein